MKGKILLIISLFILTGCSAKYNINFTDSHIIDNIEIYENSSIVNNANKEKEDEVNQLILDWENGFDFYKRELYATDTITGYRYTYEFTYEEYDAMSELRRCYEEFELINNNDYITLTTSDEFLCGTYYPNSNEITINITSQYEIESSNADKNDNNTHSWIINKNNYKDHSINLKINKTEKHKEENKPKLNIKQISVIILFIFLIIVLIIRKRRNK